MNNLSDTIKCLIVGLILTSLLSLLAVLVVYFLNDISKMAEARKKQEQTLHECFIQEPRTKECEYMIWKAEQENLRTSRKSNNLATGVAVGTAMGMAMRR